MTAEFQTVSLSEITTLVTKGTTPTTLGYSFTDSGVNFIKAESVALDGQIDESVFAHIDEATHKKLKRSQIEEGDILFSIAVMKLGKSALVKSRHVPANTNQAVAIIRADRSKALPEFLHYHFLNPDHYRYVNAITAQAAQPNINLGQVGNLPISLPPLPVQRRIAGILSAYDELIENSQRRIRLLEKMARALYREWFVHFRFPGHEKIPRVASPLGEIPRGWEVKLAKDILSRRAAGKVYRDEDVNPEGAIPVLDQSTNELLGFHDSEPDHLASPTMPMAIFGDHTCKIQLLIEPFSVGPNVVPFAAGPELPTAYVFYVVNSLVQTQEYKRHWIPLNAKEIIVADRVVAQRFASLIQPMLVEQEALRKAIRNLRRTRDLLLPRLLSGGLAPRTLTPSAL